MTHRLRPSLSEDGMNCLPIRSLIRFPEEAWPVRSLRFATYIEVESQASQE